MPSYWGLLKASAEDYCLWLHILPFVDIQLSNDQLVPGIAFLVRSKLTHQDFSPAQAIFYRISLLSFSYGYNIVTIWGPFFSYQ